MSTPLPQSFVLCAALCAAAGCATSRDLLSDCKPGRTLVISLGGVGGETVGTDFLRDGLEGAGVDCRVVAWPWSRGLAGLYIHDLWDVEDNRRRAGELAQAIDEFRSRHTDRPILLVGHSGGTAIAVFTLEALSPGIMVDQVILLAPALSGQYNLAPALRHVRQRLWSTCSPVDAVILGAGTRLLGTMDRRYEPAAGRDGLRLPDHLSAEDRTEYHKVYQARWSWPWVFDGHYGGHFGWSTPWFARQYLAPILVGGQAPDIFEPLIGQETP